MIMIWINWEGWLFNDLLAPAPIRVGECGLGPDCGQVSQIGRWLAAIIKRQTSAQRWASHITGRREETGLDVIRWSAGR